MDKHRHVSLIVDNHVVNVTATKLLSKWVVVLFSNDALQVGVCQVRESSSLCRANVSKRHALTNKH